MKAKNQEDFWSGLMFIGFGILAIVIARDYPMGSAMRMGPGYFPTLIGGALIALGVVVAVLSFRTIGEGIGRWPWRAMFAMSLAFACFAWGIDNIGFIPSLAVLIVLSALSTRASRWLEVAIETVVLIAGSWAVFIYGLELPFPLWGSY